MPPATIVSAPTMAAPSSNRAALSLLALAAYSCTMFELACQSKPAASFVPSFLAALYAASASLSGAAGVALLSRRHFAR